MACALIIAPELSLLCPYRSIEQLNYFTLCQHIAYSVIDLLCSSTDEQCITILKPSDVATKPHQLSPFSNDPTKLKQFIHGLQEPSPQLNNPIASLVEWTILEIIKYFGPMNDVHILILTGANASPFDADSGDRSAALSCLADQSHVTLTIISLNDEQISPDLKSVHNRYAPKSAIVPLKFHLSTCNTIDGLLSECAPILKSHCHVNANSKYPHDYRVYLKCGHLVNRVTMKPWLQLNDYQSVDTVHLEVFGFLQMSDLSNPPVATRHRVLSIPDKTSSDSGFSALLLASLQDSKTVAMCTCYFTDQSHPTVKQLWCHAFLHHHLLTKSPALMLSVFHEKCTGLPWLGQFDHLAPVEDFPDVRLYDDREGSSPFPVLVPDRLSYALESAPNPGGRLESLGKPPLRYISWSSTSTMLSDVNKVLRLARRLPDKSVLFFKEFAKLRSAALAYGCGDLLEEVGRFTEAIHSASTDENVTAHLVTMRRILDEELPLDV